MKPKVRVILWGLGAMGSGIARLLLAKKGFQIIGALEIDPNKVGKHLYEVLEIEPTADNRFIVSGSPQGLLKKGTADIVIISTSSFFNEVFPLIKMAIEAEISVITTAEEIKILKRPIRSLL